MKSEEPILFVANIYYKNLVHLGLITATLVTVVQAISFWLIANPLLSSVDFFVTYDIIMKSNLIVTLLGAIVLMVYVLLILSFSSKAKSIDNHFAPMVTYS